ncbi:MAG: zf-HC2 domain-containing protein [Desulfobulbaceae bacterium]|nr:zf-HC2 domain-containing protein [Desulfobulbaceae bacterium]HIJ91341.1 zf-HC2 domain-containing protein [Deltaproteobacteria bacterium]
MQCTETKPLFTDFADNTLTREELHALTDHLLGCRDCAREWQEFQQTLNLIHNLETQAPPADLLPGIQAKLAKRGLFDRAWGLAEALNFSLSIPAAAAVFTIAMLAGFLLKNSPLEQSTIFSPQSARTAPQQQGEIFTRKRPPIPPNAIFAVSHNEGGGQNGNLEPLVHRALTTHLAPDNDAHRLLSPDIHVLIENIDHDSRIALCRDILHRSWHLHQITPRLFLVHLPQADLGALHELLGRQRVALMPAAATEPQFGNGKKILTAAICFQ